MDAGKIISADIPDPEELKSKAKQLYTNAFQDGQDPKSLLIH